MQGVEYFAPPAPAGDALAQVFISSPSDGGDSMQLMYLLSITTTEHTIDLAAAYFVPDDLTRRAIRSALSRGVKVRIIVPEAGAAIYEYQPAMFHCKTMIIDLQMTSVGSTNFDNRSLRLNEEANLSVYGKSFAERLEDVFEEDLKRSRRITYESWKSRPWHAKVLETFSSFTSSQLQAGRKRGRHFSAPLGIDHSPVVVLSLWQLMQSLL